MIDERHIKQARNKQRQIDRMDKVERPVLERRKMGLAFRPSRRGGQKVVEARHLAKCFDDRLVLLDVDFTLWRGERVGDRRARTARASRSSSACCSAQASRTRARSGSAPRSASARTPRGTRRSTRRRRRSTSSARSAR